MKVGDLVKPKGRTTGDIGIVINVENFERWSRIDVLFHNGVFDVRPRDLEVINESQ